MEKYLPVTGSYSDIIKNIYFDLSNENKNVFSTCCAAAGLTLCQDYIRSNQNIWDDRKKASCKYAYENKESLLEELFAGIGCRFSLLPGDFFEKKLPRNILSSYDSLYIIDFVKEFQNTHPTLQQSFFGGYVQGLLMNPDYNSIDNFDPDEGFPLI